MKNKLPFEEFLITDSVFNQIKNNPELYNFHLSLFNNLESNPFLKWTYETLKKYENLFLTLNIQQITKEFAVNAYYHLLQLTTKYENIDLNWNSALEIAQETVIELFKNYDLKYK